MSPKNLPSVVERLPADAEERVLEDGERLERSQPLMPGHYWRAKKALKDDRIPKGCVLLLVRIKKVDEKPHAVDLAPHPLLHVRESGFTFLVHDFLDKFDPEPNGPAIRAQEMADVQADVARQQTELLEFQRSPEKLLESLRTNPALPAPKDRSYDDKKKDLPVVPFDFQAGLPGPDFRPSTSLVDLASGSNREEVERFRRQASNQAIVAKRRAEMISAKVTAIAETVKKLTPFYEEQGTVALAQSADALEMFGKLQSGLATLGLYTGKDVELTVVREGAAAPAEEPIHLLQALIYMDEESLINVVDGGVAGFESMPEFIEQLKTDDPLLQRICPFPRGIVAMRYKRERRAHPKGSDPFVAARIDNADMSCFLVVKNGERVHIVSSETFDRTDRLFPSQKDFDQPFERGFSWHGIESERITVEDLDFSEARGKLDQIVLHYRRLVVLIAGLYDRERRVIGDIPALGTRSGLALLSMPMQEAAFRPVSDEEFALTSGRPSFRDWLAEKNALTQSGSRLACFWEELMTYETAPGAVKEGSHGASWVRYRPKEPFSIRVVYKNGGLFVECPVDAEGRREDFNAAVNVSKYKHGHGDSALGFLCLDAVDPDDIDYYIRSRHDRRGYINHIRLLVHVRDLLRKDRVHEAPMRRALIDALQQGGVRVPGAEDGEAVGSVIRQWRAAHRGAPLPQPREAGYPAALKSMLAQLWVIAGRGRDRVKAAEEIAAAEGRQPLRLAMSGSGKLLLYATSATEEREDLLGKHPWVVRIALEELKTKVSVLDRRHIILPRRDARESVLHEWDAVKEWIEPKLDHGLSYEDVRGLRKLGDLALARARRWLAPRDDETFEELLRVVERDCDARSKRFVSHGHIFFPLVIARRTVMPAEYGFLGEEKKEPPPPEHSYYYAGITMDLPDALVKNATKEQRARLVAYLKRQYRNPAAATERLGKGVHLVMFGINGIQHDVKNEIQGWNWNHFETPKRRDWEKDVAAFLKAVADKHHAYHAKSKTAEPILRFDEAAAEVYRLLGVE